MNLYKDLLERVIWTFIQALAASSAVVGLDLDSLKIAGGGAILSVLKGLGATKIGDGNTAATLSIK